ADESNARSAGTLERAHSGARAPPRGEHWVEHDELAFARVCWNLEVVVDGLKRLVVAIQSDMTDAGRGHESQNALDHSEPSAQNWHERQLLSAHLPTSRVLERRLDLDFPELKLARGFVHHQHRDLVDELLKDLRGGPAVPQD